MVDSKRFLDWLVMAKKDFAAAKILLQHDADNYLVCFHCQQTVEKYLKGYLLKQTGMIIESHSLLKLCKLCAEHNRDFLMFLKDLALLNEFYIETRYPADEPLVISPEETTECLEITEKITIFIDCNLGMNV
jgi:HEPN domain-containing protein